MRNSTRRSRLGSMVGSSSPSTPLSWSSSRRLNTERTSAYSGNSRSMISYSLPLTETEWVRVPSGPLPSFWLLLAWLEPNSSRIEAMAKHRAVLARPGLLLGVASKRASRAFRRCLFRHHRFDSGVPGGGGSAVARDSLPMSPECSTRGSLEVPTPLFT